MTNKISFMWLTGHLKNVGDSMLRRPYAEYVSQSTDVCIWAGPTDEGYMQGLRVEKSALAESFPAWYLNFVKKSIRGEAHFVFNAGEFTVTKAYFGGMVAMIPWIILAKLRGGKIVWTGAGIAKIRKGYFFPFRLLIKMADVLYWRDTDSAALVRAGRSRPDWGFALQSGGMSTPVTGESSNDFPGFQERNTVSISLRGDRQYPSQRWIESLRAFASRHSFRIVTVSQVKDDNHYAEQLAKELNGEAVIWSGDDHFAQELTVRAVYRNSAVVFSDRLHGLIIAATEGAVPLGWVEATTNKIGRHFDVVGSSWTKPTGDPIDAIDALTKEDLLRYFDANSANLIEARTAVIDMVSEMQLALSDPA